jgi:adenosylmethionine-8-amino-7-oxononanoate aminotransferase
MGVSQKIAEAFDSADARLVATDAGPRPGTWMHAHTYSSHPVGCAVALANLDILEREGLLERAQALAARLASRLTPLAAHRHVGDVRWLGLMAGVELVADKQTRAEFPADAAVGARLLAATAKRGMVTRMRGDVYNFAPAYVATESQIDRMAEILAESIVAVVGP